MNIFIGKLLAIQAETRDQASVLKQIGLLNTDGLPVGGAESAKKVINESSVQSNQMIKNWAYKSR
jgi:hypothetical protein